MADPHTYPALVLQQQPEATPPTLLVFYVSDGLIPDDDEEAWSFGTVPVAHAVPASKQVMDRCVSNDTKAGRMTLRLMQLIQEEGVASFVQRIRTSPAHELERLKESIVHGR